MKKLRSYFNSLSPDERTRFLEAIGTSEAYLRKAMSIGTVGPKIAARIEWATNGAVTRAELRPDIFGDLSRGAA